MTTETTEQQTRTSSELKREAAASRQEQERLGKRAGLLPQEIAAARKELDRLRNRAARAGEDLQAVTAEQKAKIAALEQEAEDAPEHVFAARVRALELDIQAQTVRIAELEPQSQEAQQEFMQRKAEADDAREEEDRADRKRRSITGQMQEARQQRKQLQQAIKEVEEHGPGRPPV